MSGARETERKGSIWRSLVMVGILNVFLPMAYIACTVLCTVNFGVKLELVLRHPDAVRWGTTGPDSMLRSLRGMNYATVCLVHLMLLPSSSLLAKT